MRRPQIVTRLWSEADRTACSRFAKSVRRAARKFWRGLREWCGDAAYERYLRSRAVTRAGSSPLTVEEFYVEQLNRRYSRPNRCC